jgi:hypothetical protein
MSRPAPTQPTAQTTRQQVNSVDVEVEDGKEGWREYSVNDILQEMDRVVRASKEPEMVAARAQSEGLFLMKILDRFDQTPAFRNRPSLLKKIALGLDAEGKKNIGEMLCAISLMQHAPSSKVARGIEHDFGIAFNKRVAPDLVADLTPEKLAASREAFVNKTGTHANRSNPTQ